MSDDSTPAGQLTSILDREAGCPVWRDFSTYIQDAYGLDKFPGLAHRP